MKYLYQQTVRLDETLANLLRKEAKQNKRSMNSEIIAILQAHFDRKAVLTNDEIASKLRLFANFLSEKQ